MSAHFCVAAVSEWDIILGEPLLCHLKSIINIAQQSMTIQPITSQQFPMIYATKQAPQQRQTSAPTATSAQNNMWTQENDISNDVNVNKENHASAERDYIMSDVSGACV